MRYLKYYESSVGKYWLIPTEHIKYEIALSKIGCTDENWIDHNFTCFGDYIYIANIGTHWEWDGYDEYDKDNIYKDKGYTYMGIVNIEDFEINQKKYNL